MAQSNSSSPFTESEYLEIEGVAQKEKLEFSFQKFGGCWREEHLNMCFPDRDVLLPYSPSGFLCNTIAAWEADYPEACEGMWRDYIHAAIRECGEWNNRVMLPREYLIPLRYQMIAGVLNVDRRYLEAAFKRLYGRWIKPDTIITDSQLEACAHALWNPIWLEYRGEQNWAEYCDQLNRKHRIEVARKERQQAQIADLLSELEVE